MPTNTPAAIAAEIEAYNAKLANLEATHPGKFVIFKAGELAGVWDTFNAAAADAVARFGRGPYLIRQVGAPTPSLPASVFFRTPVSA